jgi:predicted ArsR family transcriptional regulator
MARLPLFDVPPAETRQRVREIIAAHASANPASIAYLRERTGLNDRAIKGIVEDLRVSGDPICARRGQPCGYFWATTAEDLEASAQTMRNQALKMLVAAGRLVGRHRLREMLGQLTTDVLSEGESV